MLSATLALFVGLAVAAPLNKRAVGQIPTATNVLTLRKSADPTYPTAFDQLAKHRLAPLVYLVDAPMVSLWIAKFNCVCEQGSQ